MATYNGARFLPAQLESIAAQTIVPDELVVGDDGSTDATEEIFAQFARTVRFPVKFTRNAARLGAAQNFVACILRSTGDVVLLSDQDDAWMPVRVERTIAALADDPAAAYVFSDAELMDERGAHIAGTLWKRAFFDADGQRAFRAHRGVDVLVRTNVVTGATMGIRRDRIASALPVPPGWIHDAWLAFLLEVTDGAVPIPEPLIRYRQHAGQQIGIVGTSPRAILEIARRHDAAFLREQGANYRVLADRLGVLATPRANGAAQKARRKADCLVARAGFREHPIRESGKFLAAVLGGDYSQYGLGTRQAVFDVAAVFLGRGPRRPQ
jgi:glycosyltransferase involved in cell wall biosynthesis